MPQIFSLPALEPDERPETKAAIRRERNTNTLIRVVSFLASLFLYNLMASYALSTKNGGLQLLAFFVALIVLFVGLSLGTRLRRRASKPREVSRVQAMKQYIQENYGLHLTEPEARRLIWPDNPLLAASIPDQIPYVTIGTMRGYATAHVASYPNDVQVVYTKEDGYMLIDAETNEELGEARSDLGPTPADS